jgi:hypothetical protein
MPEYGLFARVVALSYVFSYAVQVIALMAGCVAAFLWMRNGYAGWGLPVWLACFGIFLLCLGWRRFVLWWAPRRWPPE